MKKRSIFAQISIGVGNALGTLTFFFLAYVLAAGRWETSGVIYEIYTLLAGIIQNIAPFVVAAFFIAMGVVFFCNVVKHNATEENSEGENDDD